MKILLLSVAVVTCFSLVLAESRSKRNDDLDNFEKSENLSLMARTIFRIRRTTPSVCANKCLKMGSSCGSFEFNKNHFSCFGRRTTRKAVSRMSKKNNRRHKKFYLRADPRYDVYYKNQNKVELNEERKKNYVRPTKIQKSFRKTTTTTTQSTTTANRLTTTTESLKSYKSNRNSNTNNEKTDRVTTTTPENVKTVFVKTESTKKWNKIVFPTVNSNQRLRETSEEYKTTEEIKEQCYEPIGIESGKIEDSAFSSSSDYSSVYSASKARLNNGYAWYPSQSSAADNMFLQIDFESTFYLASIDIQGHKYWTTNYYVTYYKVEYKTKYQDEYTLYEDKSGVSEIAGPSDANTPKRYNFDTPILADSIRIIPLSWSKSGVGIRLELYIKKNC